MDKRVIQVVSTHPPTQGAFVEIYGDMFNEDEHTLYFDGADLNTLAFAAERDIAVKHGKEVTPEAKANAAEIYKGQQSDMKSAAKKAKDDAKAEAAQKVLDDKMKADKAKENEGAADGPTKTIEEIRTPPSPEQFPATDAVSGASLGSAEGDGKAWGAPKSAE